MKALGPGSSAWTRQAGAVSKGPPLSSLVSSKPKAREGGGGPTLGLLGHWVLSSEAAQGSRESWCPGLRSHMGSYTKQTGQ